MTRRRPVPNWQPRTAWQLIFALSKVNGADYHGESLPHHRRIWPRRTYLQTRLDKIRRDAR